MSRIEACPSKKDAAREARSPRELRGTTGRAYWRSLDDLADTSEFRDFLEREFPANASELLSGSRRSFLKVMGASFALAGAATIPGCRRPDHRIVAYNDSPEHIVPGKPLFYATAWPLPGGGCEGLLAETYEGRPTKLEGNPLHAYNAGKSSLRAQASILSMYDPDRNPASDWHESHGGFPTMDWKDFRSEAEGRFARFDATAGRGLAILANKQTSPSRTRLRDRLLERWPEATWVEREAVDRDAEHEGARIAFGRDVRVELRPEAASVIVSLDRDLLGVDGGLDIDRGYAASRYVPGVAEGRHAADASMSRIYTLESSMTVTGIASDHRLALSPQRIEAMGMLLADETFTRLEREGRMDASMGAVRSSVARAAQAASYDERDREWAAAMADDLVANRAKSLVVAGETQSPAVHAATHAINIALSNQTRTVDYYPLDERVGASSVAGLSSLAAAMREGAVESLVVLGGNPVYDAPADLGFAELYASVESTVYLGQPNETAAASKAYLPEAHVLETWGDVEDWDGSYTISQPMIKPLWGGHSQIEVLATMIGDSASDGFSIVRNTLGVRTNLFVQLGGSGLINPTFDTMWRRTLHDGLRPGTKGSIRPERAQPDGASMARAIGAWRPGESDGLTVVFRACQRVYDGRDADNGWLQELPDAVTKVTWDNVALVSKRTAERLDLRTGRKLDGPQYNKVQVAELTVDGRTIDVPIWVQPGMPDDVIGLTIGYGRSRCGRVGQDVGYNAYTVQSAGSPRVATGATMGPKRGASPYLLANTQDHWSMEGRALLREVDLYWWQKHGDELLDEKDSYGQKRPVRGAERLGIEGHAPLNRDVYKQPPGRGSSIFYHKVDKKGKAVLDDEGRRQHPENDHGKPIQQWGMSIDLTTCTGCGTCTVACQAENNIPIVGKMEVAKGREMQWIRVDRYYATEKMNDDAYADPHVAVQPVTCVHCENAPCEVVCPVNATVHGTEGTNDMAYNRCIGTRYCSNNCPYKVRRFNYFDYATKQYRGWTSLDPVLPDSANRALVPPRLREKVSDVQQMQNNPNVTVRSRGVMEKCTYCMQRINMARVETKLEDLDMIPDGFFQTACQQACPTNAISFGDIYDYVSNDGAGSEVYRAKKDPRTYAMLAYLNVLPRTTYQLRVRNPNEALTPRGHDPFEHGHGGDHSGGEYHGEGDHGHEEASAIMSLPILNGRGALA